ncbi:unnamed protein product, partial [Sphenostylis stenocarpa]
MKDMKMKKWVNVKEALKLEKEETIECPLKPNCTIQAWKTLAEAIHLIKSFNPSLPYNMQATISSHHLIVHIQRRPVNSIGAVGASKNQQTMSHNLNPEKRTTHGGFLGDKVPTRQPDGVATHEALVPGKAVEDGVENNEDGVAEGGEEGVGEAWTELASWMTKLVPRSWRRSRRKK